jgi:hypothetical protein
MFKLTYGLAGTAFKGRAAIFNKDITNQIMKENPNIIYGRLADATHISGYSLERAMSEFECYWKITDGKKSAPDMRILTIF